jgi:bifunctional non-homologous end joining protein LigD
VSDFDALHSRKYDERAQLYAIDRLRGDGQNLRPLLLSLRKVGLAQLLLRSVDGRRNSFFTAKRMNAATNMSC